MKKKLWIIIALVAALGIGAIALIVGGGQSDAPAVLPEATEAPAPEATVDPADLQNAIEYIRMLYKSTPVKTTADYVRIGTVRVGLQSYTVTWSVDVAEEHVKVVVGTDGNVTIDVNENSETEVPYTLTATVTDAAGNSLTTSWDYILPGVIDEEMLDIVDRAYALEEGQSLPEAVTLRGIITSIDTMYSEQYKNISVVIAVPGREDKPILCYRLKGEGADTLAVGDTITVTGIIKNYKGTIEFDAGCTLDSVVKGDNEPVKAPEDPAEIMKQAYALAPGQSLPYTATLTGTITSVDEAYSSTYKNVTVTMLVKDGGGYSIKCYRMSGTDADTLNVNDIITVTGQIKNYNGTIEFNFPTLVSVTQKEPPKQPNDPKAVVDAAYRLDPYESLPYEATLTGKVTDIRYQYSEQYPSVSLTIVVAGRENKPLYCYSMTGSLYDMKNVEVGDTVTVRGMIKNYYNTETGEETIEYDHPTLVKLVKNTAVAPSDPKKIVDEAFALANGEFLDYKATLTGKIVSIDTPYDSGYKNITVSIMVEGSNGMKKLQCYRLTGSGASGLEVGDTITVTGIIKNYNGKIEFDKGCTLDKVVKGSDEDKPLAPEDPKQIVDEAFALKPDESLPYEAQLTGKVIRINEAYSSTYKNITLTIEVEGSDGMKELKCYRLKGTGVDSIQVGDTITVKGIITHYYNAEKQYGEIEFAAGCQLVGGIQGGDDPVIPPEVSVEPVTHKDLEEGKAYKFYLEQKTVNKVLYFNGKLSGEYLATTEKPGQAADVYMEKAQGGVRFYFMDGETKTYIEIKQIEVDGKLKPRPKLSTEPTMVYTYDQETNLYVGVFGEERYYYGTYNSFETFSTSSVIFITGDNAGAAGTTQFIGQFGIYNGSAEEPEKPTDPEADSILTISQAIALGESKDHDTFTENKYYVTGTITEIYNTQYGNMRISDAAGNILTIYGTFDADGTNRFDAMEVQPVVGDKITVYGIIGQYSGAAQMKNGWIIKFGAEELPEGHLSVADAIAMGLSMEHNVYTEEKYSVTGTITEVYNTVYGNMRITDGEGNILTIYGTYDADGTNRYDAMEVKPQAGDTVTVYGIVGQYNGIPQIKNGWITEHIPGTGETPEQPEEPEADSQLTIAEAIALGQSKNHDSYTAGKYYVTGTITEIYNTQYGNMYITDATGNVLTIYGTYDADGTNRFDAMEVQPVVGDLVTIYGAVGQYNGNAQIKNGWIVRIGEEELPEGYLTIAEAVAMGAAMGHNEYTEEKFYVTGVISDLYNTVYGNMHLVDEDGNDLTIYGMYSEDGTVRYDAMEVKPVDGDTVTVYGIIGNYNGKPQMKNGWLLKLTPGEGGEEDPEVPADPEADTVLSVEAAIALGASKKHNVYTAGKYYVTGVITEVYNEVYGNMKITDEAGNILTIYGSYDADGTNRYDAMEVKPQAGDTVTLYGIIGQYNGTPQLKNGWITEHIPAGDVGCRHKSLVHVEAVEAGCHMIGNMEHWYCNDCETVWQDEELTQVTNHLNVILPATGKGNLVHMDAVEPACHYEGNVEYWICYTCEQVWTDEALTQNSNIKNVVLPRLGGDVVHVEAVTPGCESDGNIEYWHCQACQQVWSDEALTQLTNLKNVILAADHQNIVHVEPIAPGCHYDGNSEYWYCADCDIVWADEARLIVTNRKNVIMPAFGAEIIHMNAVEPGCHYEGNIEYWICYSCEKVWQDAALTQLSNIKNVVIPELGGDVTHVEAVAPTATENGNIEYWYCEACEQVWQDAALTQLTNIKNVVLPATGEETPCEHKNLVHMEAVEPGCHHEGHIEHWYCTDCETVWQDEALTQLTNHKNVILPEKGGDVTHVEAVAPTATENGNIEYWYCETCEQVWQDAALTQLTNIKNVVLPAIGEETPCEHKDLVHMEAVEPGCHYEGHVEHWYCQTCEAVWQDEALTQLTNHLNVILPEKGGDVTHVEAVAPTATENGNIEYWYCETCEQVWQDAALTQLTNRKNVILPATGEEPEEDYELTIAEAVAMGAAMEHNTYTDEKYYVSGTVSDLYSTVYGNMHLVDEDGNDLTIYGMYSEDGSDRYDAMKEKPVNGDTITVYGIIGNYNGKAQMKNGWLVELIPGETEEPTDPEIPADPEADTELTIEEAIALGKSKEHNTYTAGKYYVTGEIKKVYNTQYGNMYLTDEDGNELTLYGTYDADGKNRYDAMEVQPKAGDIITVYGIIGQFNGNPQLKNGWITEHIPSEEEPTEPEVPEEPEEDTELTIEEAIALGESKEHNTYTAGKYYVTGEIVEVYNDIYGNMKIRDEDGNILTVYGTYDAEGDLRYDAMEVQPQEGDTITVYGIIGQYNGTPQIKNGWITEHEPA